MSQENVEQLREGYAALSRGDLDAVETMGVIGPEFVFESVWSGEVYEGMEGLRAWFADMREIWQSYSQRIEEIIEAGENQAVVVIRISGEGGTSGIGLAQQFATVWTWRGNQAVRATSYPSKAEALEAVGLRE